VLIPSLALILKGRRDRPGAVLAIVSSPRAVAAFQITLTAAAIATVFNAVYGLLMAWVLVRYRFPGAACSTR
jgi:sulfate/thiosulfate transport system permease protein